MATYLNLFERPLYLYIAFCLRLPVVFYYYYDSYPLCYAHMSRYEELLRRIS